MNNLEKKILSIKSDINYDSPTPLYTQIANLIKLIIKTGCHKSGEKLPTERLLAETFNVSRVTIRKTFKELLEEGIVYKHQGSGIFISEDYKPKLPKMHIGLLFMKNRVFEFHPMNQMYFAGIKTVLAPYEYTSEIISIDLPFNALEFNKLIKKKKINGIISFIAEKDTNKQIQKALSNMPLVSRMEEFKYGYIDYPKAISDIFTYLLSQGHRNIALNYVDPNMELTDLIIRKYRQLCKEYNLKTFEYETGDFTPESGQFLIKEIIKNKDVSAIICGDDYIAMGMYLGLYEIGKKCPDDISIVGFDDYEFAKYLTPPLTTVKIPYYEMGMQLAKSVINQKVNTFAEPELIIRQSVKKI
ncbi:MAG: GntR family transcriptional regulator [Abditibacteriota bacterium]|nr:GntR family transcriptional regulator [Abditibacteriota bacterium]